MSNQYYQISKKSGYAIEALLEMALRGDNGPLNVRELAQSRHIPLRFLEVILNELKQGDFVRSVRGKSGGYLLVKPPNSIDIAQILLFLETKTDSDNSLDNGSPALKGLLADVNCVIGELLEATSLQDLADKELQAKDGYVANYSI